MLSGETALKNNHYYYYYYVNWLTMHSFTDTDIYNLMDHSESNIIGTIRTFTVMISNSHTSAGDIKKIPPIMYKTY